MDCALKFKVASEDWEFEQINRLNYQTFVEEIKYHEMNSDRKLMDRFHDENDYIICVRDRQLLGMLAVRGSRPFSLDLKIDDLDRYLPEYRSLCEIRLLAVKKERRYSRLLGRLVSETVRFCIGKGYDLAVISGILRQQKLYKHMGFVPFGDLVGNDEVKFQPMYLTLEAFNRSQKGRGWFDGVGEKKKEVILMPGPVEVSDEVSAAFNGRAVSHRSKEFMEVHKETKRLLCELVKAKNVEILMGSGTLANDVVAGQLSLLESGRGLVLSNGEFGERLVDCAERFGLGFEKMVLEWGEGFDAERVRRVLKEGGDIEWLWVVHCETSTGMLNDIDMLKGLCDEQGVRLCVDCVSSVGNVELDLSGVYLASGVSGKGLGSFSGLSMVFYNGEVLSGDGRLPRYLDLGLYARKDGVAFTVCSNLVYALNAALKQMDVGRKLEHVKELSGWLRGQLCKRGLEVLVDEQVSCPGVVTICPGGRFDCEEVGRELEEMGFLLSYRSEYLVRRNWMQICFMGEVDGMREELGSLLDRL